MNRLFQLAGLFLATVLVTHLTYVLLLPRMAAGSLLTDLRRDLGRNAFHRLDEKWLRRIVRYPVPEAAYGACLLQLDDRPVMLTGPDLRTQWAITVYSSRGDVVYAVNDRLVPEGSLRIRFEYRELDTSGGEIALPKLEERTLILPLQQASALMLLEAWPWHPGQTPLLRRLMDRLQCRPVSVARPPRPGESAMPPGKAPLPRPRPKRRAGTP